MVARYLNYIICVSPEVDTVTRDISIFFRDKIIIKKSFKVQNKNSDINKYIFHICLCKLSSLK